MRKNSFDENVIAFLVVIGLFVVIGMIGQASEPKCIKSGCDNKQASGSIYCYLHKPFTGSSSSSHRKSSSSSSTGSTSSSGSYSNKSKTTNNSSYGSSTTKKKKNNSYDDGYDDIYMDGDYDDDRYYNDSDYADGVDDAMDEFGEGW